MPIWVAGTSSSASSRQAISRMAEITQGLVSDVVEALVSCNDSAARGLHAVYRELAALQREHFDQVSDDVEARTMSPRAGGASLLAARSLEAIAEHATDMAHCVCGLWQDEAPGVEPAEMQ